MVIKVDLWSVAQILVFLIVLVFLFLIRDIILIFLGAVILSLILMPMVNELERKRVPRVLGTVLIYLLVIFILVGIIIPIVPVFFKEINFLIGELPNYYEKIRQFFGQVSDANEGWSNILGKLPADWLGQINITGRGLFSLLGTFVGWVFVLGTLFILSFYLTVQKDTVWRGIKALAPERYQENLSRLMGLIQGDISAWARGQLMIMIAVGVMDYIVLRILGINFALALAILAGLLELVPGFGAWSAGILAVLVALIQSPSKALMIAIFYLAIQQFDANFIVPNVMKRAVGLNPVIIILTLLVGAKLFGPVGVLLTVPVASIVAIIISEHWKMIQAKK